jgi:hypothetical protein
MRPEAILRPTARPLPSSLHEFRPLQLIDVMHHAVQAPLRPDFVLPTVVQPGQVLAVAQLGKHALHGADVLAIAPPTPG